MTCGYSIQTTAAPIRDWFSGPRSLRELGIPDALIEAAAKSDPLGFLPFDDLPNQIDATGSHADQATTEQSTN